MRRRRCCSMPRGTIRVLRRTRVASTAEEESLVSGSSHSIGSRNRVLLPSLPLLVPLRLESMYRDRRKQGRGDETRRSAGGASCLWRVRLEAKPAPRRAQVAASPSSPAARSPRSPQWSGTRLVTRWPRSRAPAGGGGGEGRGCWWRSVTRNCHARRSSNQSRSIRSRVRFYASCGVQLRALP